MALKCQSLHDEIIEIQVEINNQFIECGNKYFTENEMELQKIELLECEEHPNRAATVATTRERPSLGCRAIVQRSLRMIDIVARELSDWKEVVRLHSLKLLWQIVWHGEKAFTSKFIDILPVLCKCCQDDERSIVEEAERVAILMGELLNFDDWLLHALGALEKSPNHVGTMRCFGYLFSGAHIEHKKHSISTITAKICDAELCHNTSSTYQAALLSLIDQLVDSDMIRMVNKSEIDESSIDEEKHLFCIIVKTTVASYAHNIDAINERAINIYTRFCKTPENRYALQGKYGAHVIIDNEDLEFDYTDESMYVIRLYGYILLFGFQHEFYEALSNSIQVILTKGSANAKVKIFAAIASVMFKWIFRWGINKEITFLLLVGLLSGDFKMG